MKKEKLKHLDLIVKFVGIANSQPNQSARLADMGWAADYILTEINRASDNPIALTPRKPARNRRKN